MQKECAKCYRWEVKNEEEWYVKGVLWYEPTPEQRKEVGRRLTHGYCLKCYKEIMKDE